MAEYFQVAVAEQDQDLQSLNQWTRMPFRLCDARATFECLMEAVLNDLAFEVYLDDVLFCLKAMSRN